jgi:hypothetical protein
MNNEDLIDAENVKIDILLIMRYDNHYKNYI